MLYAKASGKGLYGTKLFEWLEYDSGCRLAVTKLEDVPFERVTEVARKLDDFAATQATRN